MAEHLVLADLLIGMIRKAATTAKPDDREVGRFGGERKTPPQRARPHTSEQPSRTGMKGKDEQIEALIADHEREFGPLFTFQTNPDFPLEFIQMRRPIGAELISKTPFLQLPLSSVQFPEALGLGFSLLRGLGLGGRSKTMPSAGGGG